MSLLGLSPSGLDVVALSKAYRRRPVLRDVDLTVAEGTVLAVTGSNGSGKSTLLRCIAGLASHRGQVAFRGVPMARMRSHVGYLPQAPGLPGWATVDETIDFFRRLRGADDRPPVPTGFLPDGDRRIGVLSGGQRQRVAIAVALLGDPAVLLLDEPAANLDDDARGTLWQLLSRAAEAGTTILITTPKDADLGDLPTRTVRIVDGAIAETRSPNPISLTVVTDSTEAVS